MCPWKRVKTNFTSEYTTTWCQCRRLGFAFHHIPGPLVANRTKQKTIHLSTVTGHLQVLTNL